MSSSKNLEIEYLRAAAILMTLMCHLNILLPFFKHEIDSLFNIYKPWTGVDLFFCISGYVVSKSYLDYFDNHRRQGNYAVAAQCFWLRRLYRLLPTAWLWILVPLLFSIAFNSSGIFDSWYANLRSFAAVATFTGNIANQFGVILGPNSVYWSLALEEQFYFLFPIFVLLVTSTRWRVAVLATLIALQFVLDRNPFGSPLTGMLSSLRLDAMMWGILLCLFSRSTLFAQFEPTILGKSTLWRYGVALILLYLLGAIPAQLIAMNISVGLIAIACMLLVWIASYQRNYLPVPSWLSPSLLWFGSRSYALYVIHVCSYRFSVELWTRIATSQNRLLDSSYTPHLIVTAIAFCLIAAELNYRFIETPLRRKGAAISQQRLNHYGSEPESVEKEPMAQKLVINSERSA